MRHGFVARPISACPLRMGEPPLAAGLITGAGGALVEPPGAGSTVSGAINLPPIAAPTDQRLDTATRAQEQPRGGSLAMRGLVILTWTNATSGGILTSHACPARCGARRRAEAPNSDRRCARPSVKGKPYPAIPGRVSQCTLSLRAWGITSTRQSDIPRQIYADSDRHRHGSRSRSDGQWQQQIGRAHV